MPITEFMSWVLMMVVMPNSWVMSLKSSSITIDVLGSRPELGSSQNRYLGFRAMARAMAQRFCIPPESSLGNLFSLPVRFTRSIQNWARSRISLLDILLNMTSGNITLPITVSLSKSADPWKSIPISLRNSLRCLRSMRVMSRPSYRISPSSGSKRPTIFLIRTVLPEPD